MVFLQLGVQGDGYIFIEIKMYNNGAYVTYRETTTNCKVQKGWNYLGIHVDEIYEYSYVYIYHRTEQSTAPNYYTEYQTFFKGYYLPGIGLHDDTIVLGCKTYQQWGSISAWPGSWPTDVVYGLCMKGWINTIEIWSAWGNWDWIYNADTNSPHTTYIDTNFVKAIINDVSNNFLIGISPNQFTLNSITPSSTKYFTWDSTSALVSTKTIPTTLASEISCTMTLKPTLTSTLTAPFYQPSIGRITTNQT